MKNDKKLFNIVQVLIGGFFGLGWLGFYMMYRNFLVMENERAAKWTITVSTLGFLYILVNHYFTGVLSDIFSIYHIFFGIFAFLALFFQGEFLKQHKHQFKKHSFFKVFLLCILFWVGFVIISVNIAIFAKLLGFSEEVTPQSSNSLDPDQQVPVHSSEEVTEQTPSAAREISSSQETSSDWKDFFNEEIGIALTYPEAWGTAEVRTDFGVPSTSPEVDPACLADENLASTIACTGALVGFVQDGEQFRPFLAVHGTYTEPAAQGAWWGLQAKDQAEGMEAWSENPTLLGRPNTHLYRTESTGDMRVQYIIPQHDDISHIVVASPIAFGAVSSESRDAFQLHLQRIPPPPEYSNNENWAEEYAVYQKEVERFDVSEDEEVQKYLQMLRSVAIVN